jgi:membrane protein YdbS with pleckstrin-like domain
MDLSPVRNWNDGDTFVNNSEDRIGAIFLSIFAAILSFWIVPELLRYLRKS